jgi:hypothetical protein
MRSSWWINWLRLQTRSWWVTWWVDPDSAVLLPTTWSVVWLLALVFGKANSHCFFESQPARMRLLITRYSKTTPAKNSYLSISSCRSPDVDFLRNLMYAVQFAACRKSPISPIFFFLSLSCTREVMPWSASTCSSLLDLGLVFHNAADVTNFVDDELM